MNSVCRATERVAAAVAAVPGTRVECQCTKALNQSEDASQAKATHTCQPKSPSSCCLSRQLVPSHPLQNHQQHLRLFLQAGARAQFVQMLAAATVEAVWICSCCGSRGAPHKEGVCVGYNTCTLNRSPRDSKTQMCTKLRCATHNSKSVVLQGETGCCI